MLLDLHEMRGNGDREQEDEIYCDIGVKQDNTSLNRHTYLGNVPVETCNEAHDNNCTDTDSARAAVSMASALDSS